MPVTKKPVDGEFIYTTNSGKVIALPPLAPTFGQLRKIRKLSYFDQFATLVEEVITDEKTLTALDALPEPEVDSLREEWLKHSRSLELGE